MGKPEQRSRPAARRRRASMRRRRIDGQAFLAKGSWPSPGWRPAGTLTERPWRPHGPRAWGWSRRWSTFDAMLPSRRLPRDIELHGTEIGIGKLPVVLRERRAVPYRGCEQDERQGASVWPHDEAPRVQNAWPASRRPHISPSSTRRSRPPRHRHRPEPSQTAVSCRRMETPGRGLPRAARAAARDPPG